MDDTNPETPPAEPTVAAELAKLGELEEGGDFDAYTAVLATESHTSQIAANLSRIKLGITLNSAGPKPRNGRKAWQEAQSARLGIRPRQLRTILATAQVILAVELPIAVLDRPLEKVVKAAEAIKAGRDPDAKREISTKPSKPAGELVDAAVKKLEAAIKDAPSSEREHLIKRVFDAIAALENTAPGG